MKTVYYFTAEWCAPCIRTRPIVKELSVEHPEIKFQFIDADDNPELVNKFNIKNVPCFVLYKDNTEVNRIIGKQTRQQLEDFINEG